MSTFDSAKPRLNKTFVLLPFTLVERVGGFPSLSTLFPNFFASIGI